MKLNKKVISLLLLSVSVVTISGWAVLSKTDSQASTVKTSTQKVVKGDLKIGLTVDGRINLSLTNLNFGVSGIVKKINVTNGQTVTAGTVLAELDDTDLQQALKKAQNAYDKAKASYNDALSQREINIMSEKLKLNQAAEKSNAKPDDAVLKAEYALEQKRYDNLVNSDSSIKNAKLGLEDAQNSLDAAKENLSKVVLKAPADGKIINIAYKVGELVDNSKATIGSSSSAFMVLCDPSAITMKSSVTEGDIKGMQQGQAIRVTIDAAELQNLSGSVTSISSIPKVDSSGIVTYEVIAQLAEPNPAIMDGMSSVITFIKKEKNGILLVPNKAVFLEAGKQYVNVQTSDGNTEKRPVTCGLTNGVQTEVTDGLTEGEIVVIGGVKK